MNQSSMVLSAMKEKKQGKVIELPSGQCCFTQGGQGHVSRDPTGSREANIGLLEERVLQQVQSSWGRQKRNVAGTGGARSVWLERRAGK